MDRVLVTVFGGGLIGLVLWFFLGRKQEVSSVSERQTIIIDGGYRPDVIRVPRDKPVTLTFWRKDSNSCLEEVTFPDYKIRKFLPLNQKVEVVLPLPHPDKSEFHCAMNMYHGTVVAVN